MAESTPAARDEATDRASAASAADGPPALVTWCLGTFHVAVLTVVAVFLLQRGGAVGDALSGLDTAIGLGLYAFLWAITLWTTRRGLRAAWRDGHGLAWMDGLGSALVWGGVTGVAFFGGLVAAFVVVVVAQGAGGQGADMLATLGVVLVGALIAALVGALVGGLLGLLDFTVLWAARTLNGPTSNGHD
jgi:hypothetical protein